MRLWGIRGETTWGLSWALLAPAAPPLPLKWTRCAFPPAEEAEKRLLSGLGCYSPRRRSSMFRENIDHNRRKNWEQQYVQ